jgi:two-component system response regulator AtoC
MPALRERREDISLLAAYFVSKYGSRVKRRVVGLTDEARAALLAYDWPGNVRELENLIKRMVIIGTDAPIRREVADAIAGRAIRVGPIPALQHAAPVYAPAAPAAQAPPLPPAPPRVLSGSLKDIGRSAAREAERELIYRTLQHTRWNRREAAEILGISYKALLYKIKDAELDKAL